MLDQAEQVEKTGAPASEMTTIEIIQELETVTSRIEAERVRERDARSKYKTVAEEVERKVKEIRDRANYLLREQQRRLDSFSGLVADKPQQQVEARPRRGGGGGGSSAGSRNGSTRGRKGGRRSIAEAILEIWSLERYTEPLTTDEIIEALGIVGYESNASARSLKSSLNQALARLCKDGKIVRYRLDGDQIPESDTVSRARRYMAAPEAVPEEELLA
jgi:ElaB/YqjD/DUF883 family membrane-anchored ribosome-binding protein